ncbi:MAG: rhomboid family intramembrane serine protease [Bacteroidetes bacterium]|jgi:membrane associated rhomboid family serine protease|nr:rhomboid family intramembrane serine protease [Bacteroidota bacterium]MBK7587493.1 rhomboid family intramembrane serine protease [Bacteroidota bacterium]MBK8329750.1 rhomboid family intramembrane serine protease [Bacteroidota bacterium]MBK9301701.1 rhomboid family intramembrane serine protease [Bacteroidota bacterium]MBK9482035.1 rhomboid family intramembrane serine protease [Bacteroidota bacterium]
MEFRPSRFEVIPPVVKNLLIINALVFFATIVIGKMGFDITEYLALHHWSSDKFKVWQIVTHLFMHGGNINDPDGGFLHLFSNMFALWMFGAILENYFGPKRFLTFYFLCGIGAAILYLGVLTYDFSQIKSAIADFNANPTYKQLSRYITQNHISENTSLGQILYNIRDQWAENPMSTEYASTVSGTLQAFYTSQIDQGCVGASGAVFGILFAFGYLFPNTLLYMYFLFPIKAKYFVGFYALFELYAGIKNNAGDNVAHFAHIGGMIVAFIVIKIWNRTHRKNFF